MLRRLLELLLTLPPGAVYSLVGGLAAMENVFPPVPADTAVAIGAFISSGGAVSAPVIFLITWVANTASGAGVYVFARRIGRPFFQSRLGLRLLHPSSFARLERLYAHYGVWGIFFSRFIPGARAVVLPFAGVVRLNAARALLPAALASGVWYGALTVLVVTFAKQIEDLALVIDRLNTWVVAFALAALVAVTLLVRRRRLRDRMARRAEAP